ncbi:DUF4397 domain-containing protein [Chitinophaga varians]|uniref:DUF4397 domain-containing protein n=1 Tax=Chitinophaga varians TaxID=2202339 RepID=A0A847S7N7_9BACT|nr:DUF4397 domain-containing protein [Chitinophaga varians]NLR67681.1 DUF4397 domain-containing protein [Chitinophaga varians]
MMTTKYHTLLAGVLLLAAACSKDKTDVRAGNEPDYASMDKSTVRLVTFNQWDVKVNGQKLSNWYQVPDNVTVPNLPYPTRYFPDGKLSGTWFLPQQFLDSKGQATVEIGSPQGTSQPDYILDSFLVQDNYDQPSDYYLNTSADEHDGKYSVSRVPRTTALPSNPANIRIRLVNLCTSQGNGGGNTLSLAYANGGPVSAATSGIANHSFSDYVELPYGTYQFKVLIDGTGLQIPGKPPALTGTTAMDNFSLGGTQVYYSPVQTFQPGGVYTVAVGLTYGAYQYGEYPLSPNCFTVVTDIAPAANLTYGRLQVVNAAVPEGEGLGVNIDGGNTSTIAYGKAGAYKTLITGTHTLKITDATGKTLAEQTIALKGGDNLTAWAYPAAGGSVAVTVVSNNMGGVRVNGGNPDGSDGANNLYDPLHFRMLVQTRFLNLCPDLPEVTFTGANGTLFKNDLFTTATAAQHLQAGQQVSPIGVPYPYVDLGAVTGGIVQAYRSQPGVLPGDRLTDVPALTTLDFVQMPPAYFLNGNYGAEPGVYTVALIGRKKDAQHPRMIVIKHNQ